MEEWKPIPEAPGYEISNLGRVMSHWGQGRVKTLLDKPGHIIKTNTIKTGQIIVTLRCNNKPTNRSVARLVAQAFVPNPDNYCFVICRDGNHENVRADNLKWARRVY